MNIAIRKIERDDEARWRELWAGYCHFYEREPDPAITAHTWSRLMNDASPVYGIVAVDAQGQVIGIANYLLHENTSTLTPVCYLQDLYVDPAIRAKGAGKLMIDWLVAEMAAQRWSRLYWATKENNYRARGMYDKFTPHSGFLRYVLVNSAT